MSRVNTPHGSFARFSSLHGGSVGSLHASRSPRDESRSHTQSHRQSRSIIFFDERLEEFNRVTGSKIPLSLVEAILACSIANGHLLVDLSQISMQGEQSPKTQYVSDLLNLALPILFSTPTIRIDIRPDMTPDDLQSRLYHEYDATKSTTQSITESSNANYPNRDSAQLSQHQKTNQPGSTSPEPHARSSTAAPFSLSSSAQRKSVRISSQQIPTNLSITIPERQPTAKSSPRRSSANSFHGAKKSSQQKTTICFLIIQDIHKASADTQEFILQIMNGIDQTKTPDGRTHQGFVVIVVVGGKEKKLLHTGALTELVESFMMCSRLNELPMFTCPLVSIPPIMNGENIQDFRRRLPSVYLDESLSRYLRNILTSLRNHPNVLKAPCSRCLVNIETLSRAVALLFQVDFLTPDIVTEFARGALIHQITTRSQTGGHVSAYAVVVEVIRRTVPPF
eukprot:TRINITY_DN10163_c0_g1_i2.p1 TRINITY_DN10163_c0_g1~~TRINITY_DN10163_c0_g1_i2.p1  ORF type:complete len:452 (+),score=67.04 TRINITY_DN10163_c0_g1_i2:65-1420(+)